MSSSSSMLSLFTLLSFSLFVSTSAQFNFPCPTPPAAGQKAVTASDFFNFHHQFPAEWYYVTGNLCEVDDFSDFFSGCNHPIGFQLTQWLYNTTVSGVNLIGAAAQLAVSSSTRYQAGAQGLPLIGLLNSFNLAFVSTSVLTSFTLLHGTAGQPGAVYHFSGTSPNATIDLTVRAVSPLLYDGQGGYAPTLQGAAPGVCTSYYYLSVPSLATIGTITLNGETKFVRGTSWFDHQWGASPSAVPHSGWIWIGLHVGKLNVLVFIPRLNQENLLDKSWINIQNPDGTQSTATVTSVSVINTWTSPSSGITYPIKLSFQTDAAAIEELLIAPLWADQEDDLLGTLYWEGDVAVTVQSGPNTGVTGTGYLELVGFVHSA